jgi:transcription antitermination factor NusG
MEKSWYIIYTKPQCENSVATALAKRKIEQFLPLTSNVNNLASRNKLKKLPLFPGYVFAYLTGSELSIVPQITGAVNPVFWKGKPVIVPGKDIQVIKDFTSIYDHIKLIPIKVNENEEKSNINKAPLIVGEKPFSHFSHSLSVSLPSLGYILSANEERKILFNNNISYNRHEKALN